MSVQRIETVSNPLDSLQSNTLTNIQIRTDQAAQAQLSSPPPPPDTAQPTSLALKQVEPLSAQDKIQCLLSLFKELIATPFIATFVREYVIESMAFMEKEGEVDQVISKIKEECFCETSITQLAEAFALVWPDELSEQELLAILCLFSAAYVTNVLNHYPTLTKERNPIVHLTQATFDKEVLESTTPVLVFCYASAGEFCKIMAASTLDLARELQGTVKVAKLDLTAETTLTKTLKIEISPTFLFYKKGQLPSRIEGTFMSKEDLQAAITQHLLI